MNNRSQSYPPTKRSEIEGAGGGGGAKNKMKRKKERMGERRRGEGDGQGIENKPITLKNKTKRVEW